MNQPFFMIVILCMTFIANLVGIISGFGTGTIMTPVLLFFMPYGQALLISTVIVWFHNLFKASFFCGAINYRLMLYFGLPSMATAYWGASLVGSSWVQYLPVLLGWFLILYVLLIVVRPHFKMKESKTLAVVGGSLSGFSAGLFGSKGPVRTVFLSMYDLPKEVYLGTVGAISLLVDSTRLITYVVKGVWLPHSLWLLLVGCVVVAYLGSLLARALLNKIPQKHFRIVVAIFLFLIGVRFAFFPYQPVVLFDGLHH